MASQRMPIMIIVDCPNYVGPCFYSADELKEHPERRTWIPFRPRPLRAETDKARVRIQFPFVLGWALTPWKAQGMTLDKAIVKVGHKASTPGVLFTTRTRVRHPDDLMLDDDFPDMATIMRQAKSASFQKRQKWERLMRVFFSRTLRRHMRDAKLYTPSMVWSETESHLADQILQYIAKHASADDKAVEIGFLQEEQSIAADVFQPVWERLQKWPHNFEILAARGIIQEASLHGEKLPSVDMSAALSRVTASGYYVFLKEWLSYVDHGVLSLSAFEFLAKLFRKRLSKDVVLYTPHLLTKATPDTTLDMILQMPRGISTAVQLRVYPYLSKSLHWAFLLVKSTDVKYYLDMIVPRGVSEDAFSWIRRRVGYIFQVSSVNVHYYQEQQAGDVLVFAQVLAYLETGAPLHDMHDAPQAPVSYTHLTLPTKA